MTLGERIVIYVMATIILLTWIIMNPSMARTYTGRVGRCDPGTPITISSGGTYSGCYMSRRSDVPAVNITTTAAVTLSRAKIHHKGQGVRGVDARASLTVQDSVFVALNPGGTPVYQTDIYLYQPSAVAIENNRFTDGHGVLLNGDTLTTNPLSISRNDFINVGRYDQPVEGAFGLLGAIHFDKVTAPSGATLSWNRMVNTYGQSLNEDVIGIYQSHGASGNVIMVDHNLINGSYPLSGDGAGFLGSGINIGDSAGTWQTGDSNTVVNTTNIGISVAFETTGNNLTHTNSKAVSDGKAGINDSGPTVSSTFGNGINAAGGNVTGPIIVTNNQSGWRRWNGTSFEAADFFIPDATTSTGNTNVSPVNAAAEQAAVDAWEASRVSNSVTVGPR